MKMEKYLQIFSIGLKRTTLNLTEGYSLETVLG